MAIESDVLVVGGGLAGATAALAAAREGAHVRLVSHKKSTLRQASGLVDVLGYVAGDGPVVDPFDRLGDLHGEHPYRVVGPDAIRDGLALFDDVAGDAYLGGHTDRNALVPTHGGTVKPTARYPAASAAGLASDGRDTLLVGFEGLTAFDAPAAAATLEDARVPFDVAGTTVRFPLDLEADAKVTRYAEALDADEDGCRAGVADAVEPTVDDAGADRVGLPAVLGRHETRDIRADLESRLGCAVFEVPMGPPSLPGLRLESLLYDALDDAGVAVETGNPVVGFDAEGGGDGGGGDGSSEGESDRIDSVTVDRTGPAVAYAADEFVLATGGLVGRGIDSDRSGVAEPVFGCHVPHPEDRYDWSAPAAFGDHAFARFGVVPDVDLRPLDAAGDPEFANLRAAGAVLGGADVAAECSASGVSLATGVVAGREAARTAGRSGSAGTPSAATGGAGP